MNSRYPKYLLTLFLFLFALPTQAWLGKMPDEAETLGNQSGYTVTPAQTGTEGCLKGKRYLEMKKGNTTVWLVFLHPIYQEATAVVSQVIFNYSPPVGKGQARQDGISVAPVAGTRGPTHTQTIKPDPKDPCVCPKGGKEERFTEDYILEYCNGGGGIGMLRVYNDFIR